MDGRARIALVSFNSLGDGLIYLVIANNLQRNGFDVTCYGNVAHEMRSWLPALCVRPYPSHDRIEAELAEYDLAIVSPSCALRANMDEATTARLREKWLLICQRAPGAWHFDHTERIRNSCSPEKFRQLSRLLNGSGSIRFREFDDESVVEISLQYLREKMNLGNVTKKPPIVAPEGLSYRRHERRIVVS